MCIPIPRFTTLRDLQPNLWRWDYFICEWRNFFHSSFNEQWLIFLKSISLWDDGTVFNYKYLFFLDGTQYSVSTWCKPISSISVFLGFPSAMKESFVLFPLFHLWWLMTELFWAQTELFHLIHPALEFVIDEFRHNYSFPCPMTELLQYPILFPYFQLRNESMISISIWWKWKLMSSVIQFEFHFRMRWWNYIPFPFAMLELSYISFMCKHVLIYHFQV